MTRRQNKPFAEQSMEDQAQSIFDSLEWVDKAVELYVAKVGLGGYFKVAGQLRRLANKIEHRALLKGGRKNLTQKVADEQRA